MNKLLIFLGVLLLLIGIVYSNFFVEYDNKNIEYSGKITRVYDNGFSKSIRYFDGNVSKVIVIKPENGGKITIAK